MMGDAWHVSCRRLVHLDHVFFGLENQPFWSVGMIKSSWMSTWEG